MPIPKMDSVVILKFGGKLLESPEKILRAAQLITSRKESGDNPVVVVSASGNTTDKLLELVSKITDNPTDRELDMILSVGERTAMALLAIAINRDQRYHAVSFTGSQVGIITDSSHTDAKIIEVRCFRIRESLKDDQIPIVAGFQGVSTEREITTLGRGGSDATAISLAIALNAKCCDLIKETGGVYTADPEIIPKAIKHPELDYLTLKKMTYAGAEVVQSKAVELAEQHSIKIHISDVNGKSGTIISKRKLSAYPISGLVLKKGLFLCKLSGSKPETRNRVGRLFFFRYHGDEYIITQKRMKMNAAEKVSLINIIVLDTHLSNIMNIVEETFQELNCAAIVEFGSPGIIGIVVPNEIDERLYKALHGQFMKKGLLGNIG